MYALTLLHPCTMYAWTLLPLYYVRADALTGLVHPLYARGPATGGNHVCVCAGSHIPHIYDGHTGYHVCAAGRRSRWVQRFVTIPCVLDISVTHSTRPAQLFRHQTHHLPILRSRAISLIRFGCTEIARDRVARFQVELRFFRHSERVECVLEMSRTPGIVTNR